jgi:hypothetical protein
MAASISYSSRKDAASAVESRGVSHDLNKVRKELPLPSQEGTKGVIQYALYVPRLPSFPGCCPGVLQRPWE